MVEKEFLCVRTFELDSGKKAFLAGKRYTGIRDNNRIEFKVCEIPGESITITQDEDSVFNYFGELNAYMCTEPIHIDNKTDKPRLRAFSPGGTYTGTLVNSTLYFEQDDLGFSHSISDHLLAKFVPLHQIATEKKEVETKTYLCKKDLVMETGDIAFCAGKYYEGIPLSEGIKFDKGEYVDDHFVPYNDDWFKYLVEEKPVSEDPYGKQDGPGSGLRYNDGKLRYDLLHPKAVAGITKVMTKGAEKYFDRNWENGMGWTTVLASLKRHLAAFESGEDYDPETGELHVDHLQCNAHFLSAYYNIFPQGDDRPKTYFNKRIALDIDGVLADFNEAVKDYAGIDNHPNHWFYSYKFNSKFCDKVKKDKNFWLDIPPFFDGSEIPFEPVAYVTTRPIPADWVKEWLEKNHFPCVPVHVVGHSKVAALKELNVDAFVDDRYENFAELNNNGIFTYLYDQPWNAKYDVGHRRLKNLKDLL